MEWLTQNWFWVVIFIVFIGMHLFGHGGHGGGGCGGGHGSRRPREKEASGAERPQGHQH